jgi:hypothetical protein
VSILNVVSKILEKVVYDQVEAYFKDKDLCINFNQVSGGASLLLLV